MVGAVEILRTPIVFILVSLQLHGNRDEKSDRLVAALREPDFNITTWSPRCWKLVQEPCEKTGVTLKKLQQNRF